MRGKYKEVFNSEWKKFGGDEKVNGQIIKSDNDGDDMEYIDITLLDFHSLYITVNRIHSLNSRRLLY